MKNVSLQFILNTKQIVINQFFTSFAPFIRQFVFLLRLHKESAKIFLLHSSLYFFSVRKMSFWKLSPCSSERVAMIQESIRKGMQKITFMDTQLWYHVLKNLITIFL